MSRATEILSTVILTAVLLAVVLPLVAIQAADDGPSALPRREDVTYYLPGVNDLPSGTLSWLPKYGNDSAFAGIDSVTPSVWLSGPVYIGITWFWKESGLPGDIEFVGFSANLDTTTYDPPMRWLPLDPVTTASWETTSTSSKGETWTFRMSYDGLDTLLAGPLLNQQEFICWRILLEQTGPSTSSSGGEHLQSEAFQHDGMGVFREMNVGAKAFTDTLYYEVDAFPRRRIRSTTAFPQSELLYRSHVTRETPVPNEGTGVGGFKSRFRK